MRSVKEDPVPSAKSSLQNPTLATQTATDGSLQCGLEIDMWGVRQQGEEEGGFCNWQTGKGQEFTC